jgi:hypothetical protein
MDDGINAFAKYEEKLKELRVQSQSVPLLWRKLLERSIVACDMHVDGVDEFRVKIDTLERHLSHALSLQAEWTSISDSFDDIKAAYGKLPTNIPRTETVRRRIENRLRRFPLSYSKQAIYQALELLQREVDHLGAAALRHTRKRLVSDDDDSDNQWMQKRPAIQETSSLFSF